MPKTHKPLPIRCQRCGSTMIVPDGSSSSQVHSRIQRWRCKHCNRKWGTPPIVPLREGYLDIETTNLKAPFGILLSWAIKPRGKTTRARAIRTVSKRAEKELLRSLLKELTSYDIVYGWYSANFDLPWIRTRALYHGLDFPPYGALLHKDLWYVSRSKLCMHSNRLAAVAEFLGIRGKTAVQGEVWTNAMLGDRRAIKEILAHNIADVVVLEKVHKRIKHFYKSARTSI